MTTLLITTGESSCHWVRVCLSFWLSYANEFTGHTLCRKILLALAESSRQQRIFEDITLTIQGRNDAIIPMWMTMIKLWEADKAQPNPYEFTKTHSGK